MAQQKGISEILRDREEQLRLLVASVKDYAILMLDSEGFVLSWNDGAERIKGYRADEIIGQHFSAFYPVEDIEKGKPNYELEVAAENGSFEDEGWRLRKDGSRFWANVVITALRDDQGELRGFGKVTRDITERKQSEEKLQRQSTHLEAKDEFLSHVSHELRSPLTAIYQFVTILCDGLAGDVNLEQQEYLEIILRNVKQLQSMIHDLLEVTRAETGKLTVETQCTSAADAIAYTFKTLEQSASAKGIVLTCDGEKTLPSVCADPLRLRQMLMILIDNAIKFTPASGTVKILSRVSEKDAGFLLVEVCDSGCGIPLGMTERIFERLVQTSEPGAGGRNGLGLGLYICKELVTRQNGKIWATSAPGRGSIFSIMLPVFSLSTLMAPSLRGRQSGEDELTLVITEIGSASGWLSEDARGDQCHRIRGLLKGCLHSNLDVVFPRMGFAGPAELFFIVAVTGRIGGQAIVKRIQSQLDGCDEIRQEGLTFSICYRCLEDTGRRADESLEQCSERIAARVRELMDQEFSSRMVVHG